MPTARNGSIRLFRFFGITVFLHWSWFLVAAYEISTRSQSYSSATWNVLEYLALFVIVLLHEFGHALACRQVGGEANQIILWPLGGVAYVNPPPRPGATLWAIAAGPLVNVALVPVLFALGSLSRSSGWAFNLPNAYALLRAVFYINAGLFVFNMLPVYPLDGGQILRSLLWFVLGRARSLMVATVIGLLGIAGFIAFAFWVKSTWLGILAAFMLLNCWGGLQHARVLARFAKLPRREALACPRCNSSPPIGEFWRCNHCGQAFDTFVTQAKCPSCSAQFATTKCLDCGGLVPFEAWTPRTLAVSKF